MSDLTLTMPFSGRALNGISVLRAWMSAGVKGNSGRPSVSSIGGSTHTRHGPCLRRAGGREINRGGSNGGAVWKMTLES